MKKLDFDPNRITDKISSDDNVYTLSYEPRYNNKEIIFIIEKEDEPYLFSKIKEWIKEVEANKNIQIEIVNSILQRLVTNSFLENPNYIEDLFWDLLEKEHENLIEDFEMECIYFFCTREVNAEKIVMKQ